MSSARPLPNQRPLTDGALSGSVADFHRVRGPDLLDRWTTHQDWWDERLAAGVDAFCKVSMTRTGADVIASYRDGAAFAGVNFASQDYLSLSSHPALIAAMNEAVAEFGLHSAGSAALMGNTRLSVELEQALADFLHTKDCTLFSTGWGAGYGIIKALVRPEDHVVIDVLAHACLQDGARSATRNISTTPHVSVDAIRRRLSRIRANDAQAGILVVTEGVFSMDSDVPDILAIQDVCRDYGATLMLDVAHDLGSMGPGGGGQMELQGALGKIDIVMGSFSKTFASNGGFVASNHPALKQALRSSCSTQTFTNALSPLSAGIVRAALDIVRSSEGGLRRDRLMRNVLRLRGGLEQAGFTLLGQPSAIVPVVLGESAPARRMTKRSIELGAVVNLIEYPAVARHACRWRLQVMADHDDAQIDHMISAAVQARNECGGREA